MTHHVLVLACSASKVAQAGAKAPAIAVYDGPAWRVLRAWQRRHPVAAVTGNLTVYALSARHGFIPAEQPIADYDEQLTADRVRTMVEGDPLAHRIQREEVDEATRGEADVLLVGGMLYDSLFAQLVPQDLMYRRAGDEGRGIGDQLAELREWLEDLSTTPEATS